MIPELLLAQFKTEGRLTLNLKVIPKSSRNEIIGLMEDGTLKIKVTAAPEKGKANAAVCEFLAQQFGISQRSVALLRGETSQLKTVLISRG